MSAPDTAAPTVLVDLKAADNARATKLAELLATMGLGVVAHPRFPTRLTVKAAPVDMLSAVYAARSHNYVTADAAFEAAAELASRLLFNPVR